MLAYRLLHQTQPEFQEVPEPRAGPGQVVVESQAPGSATPTSPSSLATETTGGTSSRLSHSGTRSQAGSKRWGPE